MDGVCTNDSVFLQNKILLIAQVSIANRELNDSISQM